MNDYPLLLETIRVEAGWIQNLAAHLDRMGHSRKALKIPLQPIDFEPIHALAADHSSGVYKLRIVYADALKEVTIEPYQIRPVKSLKVVNTDHVVYTHKYADRTIINALFQQRGAADDVLLVKNGRLTDTSHANIALFDGQTWYTPAHPLLPGTHRKRLLEASVLQPKDILLEDLPKYRALKLFNAMMTWEESPVIPVYQIQ